MMECQNITNLFLLLSIIFLTGFSSSLPIPFYPQYALNRGISITQTGLVFGSFYLAKVISSSFLGKYMKVIGGTKCVILFSASFLAIGNIGWALLYLMDNTNIFLILSFASRIMVGLGEGGVIPSAYTLTGQQASSDHMGKLMCAASLFHGFGGTLGQPFGAVLYEIGGISLPFVVCGTLFLVAIVLSSVALRPSNNEYEDMEKENKNVLWSQALLTPGVFINLFSIVLAASAYKWTSSSLQPFLMKTFDISTSETSLIIMIITIVYTITTPIIGILLDLGLNMHITLFLGILISCISFIFIGPVPQLFFLGSHIWLTAASHGLNGLAFSTTYLGSLVYITKCGITHLPNTDQSKGMVLCLWSVSYSIGCILGSTLGGLAYDKVGFHSGTAIEAAVMAFTMVVIGLFIGWKR